MRVCVQNLIKIAEQRCSILIGATEKEPNRKSFPFVFFPFIHSLSLSLSLRSQISQLGNEGPNRSQIIISGMKLPINEPSSGNLIWPNLMRGRVRESVRESAAIPGRSIRYRQECEKPN